MKTFKLSFFKDCKNLDEVKNLYKTLAKQNHPDKGGNVETMKAINLEYETACKIVLKKSGVTSQEFESEILESEAYKNAVNSIIHLEDLIIEIVGRWVWVTGETKTHKEILKAAGFFYASKKQAWYFRTGENKARRSGKSLNEIKTKYGATSVKSGRAYVS